MNPGLPLLILASSGMLKDTRMTGKSFANILMIAVITFCALSLQGTAPKPDAPDPDATAAIAQKIPGDIAKLQAQNYADVAKQLRAGTLKTDLDSGEVLEKRNKAALDVAFKSLDEHLQAQLGDGKFTPDKAAATYEAISKGLQKGGGK